MGFRSNTLWFALSLNDRQFPELFPRWNRKIYLAGNHNHPSLWQFQRATSRLWLPPRAAAPQVQHRTDRLLPTTGNHLNRRTCRNEPRFGYT